MLIFFVLFCMILFVWEEVERIRLTGVEDWERFGMFSATVTMLAL